jgi:hypothetical protein
MDERTILIVLLERLDGQVGQVSAEHSAFWVGDHEGEAEVMRRLQSGELHLKLAVRMAREAIESGDPDTIATAALLCPTFEWTGREMAGRCRTLTIKRKGGKCRGIAQQKEAEARLKPYTDRYRELLASGTPYLKARRLIKAQMVKDEFPEPSVPTFAKWFSKNR